VRRDRGFVSETFTLLDGRPEPGAAFLISGVNQPDCCFQNPQAAGPSPVRLMPEELCPELRKSIRTTKVAKDFPADLFGTGFGVAKAV
jgi:hypothetical protein